MHPFMASMRSAIQAETPGIVPMRGQSASMNALPLRVDPPMRRNAGVGDGANREPLLVSDSAWWIARGDEQTEAAPPARGRRG